MIIPTIGTAYGSEFIGPGCPAFVRTMAKTLTGKASLRGRSDRGDAVAKTRKKDHSWGPGVSEYKFKLFI